MFVEIKKWGYLSDFLSGNPKGIEHVSILLQINCINKNIDHIKIKHDFCIKCFFCLVNCPKHLFAINKTFQITERCSDYNSKNDLEIDYALLTSFLNGQFVKISESNDLSMLLSKKYSSFEDFASLNETQNIAVWALAMFKFLSIENDPVIGREINMIIKERDRGGRLDVCLLSQNKHLFCIETKVNFEKMMQEDRYVSQLIAYKKEIINTLENMSSTFNAYEMILIDGDETKLLFPSHPNCSSKIGQQSELFYKNIKDHNLFFVSTSAIIGLVLKKLYIDNQKYSLEIVFPKIYKKNIFGLLSSGVVYLKDDKYEIVSLDNFLKES
jgi:hypothetical protein